jgi:hypothetical protein
MVFLQILSNSFVHFCKQKYPLCTINNYVSLIKYKFNVLKTIFIQFLLIYHNFISPKLYKHTTNIVWLLSVGPANILFVFA